MPSTYHKVVVKLHDGIDLFRDLLHLLRELFWILWRDVHVLHLRCLSIRLQLICLVLVVVVSENARWQLVEQVFEHTGVRVLGLLNCAFKLLQFRLCGLVREFTHDGMKEVNAAESAGDDRVDWLPGTLQADLCVATDMREDVAFTKLNQGKLSVVRV